ncbi:MAG: hypothetical protein OET44_02470 [Gammaproteobacteria bacterium]|nr:hypothetical protein [Gammaproteobacteria bacterium]
MRALTNLHYAAHKIEHDRFLTEVSDVVANFGEESMDGLARRVRDWIVSHITTFDRQLLTHGL